MTKSIYLVSAMALLVGTVGLAAAAYAEDIDAIQIKSTETKDISWFIPNRIIKTMEYTVHLRGYRLECVSIMFTRPDGAVLSHAHNECMAHLEGE